LSREKLKGESKGNSKGSYCATFIGAVLVSLVLAYFLLPLLLPTTPSKGLIRQTQIVESHADATIEAPIAFAPIPGMTLEISTIDESYLQATLSSGIILLLTDDGSGPPPIQFSGTIIYEISLIVQGVGNRTVDVGYSSTSKINSTVTITQTFYLDYLTGPLSAGTYNVTAYWRFRPGTTFTGRAGLSMTAGTGSNNYTRSLIVQEISG
jgi:hypothetical protein